MTIEKLLSSAIRGENPFAVFEAIQAVDQDQLLWRIRRMPYVDFLRTLYWFSVSSVAKSWAGMRCQICNDTAMVSAHHRTYDCHGKEHACMNDLTCLCDPCHKMFHGRIPKAPVSEMVEAQSIVAAVREALADERKTEKRSRKLGRIPDRVAQKVGDIDSAKVRADMPPGEGPVMLTRELVNRCRTNGAFTNEAVRWLGARRPLQKGWPERLAGREISRDNYRRALEGRYIYNSGPLQTEAEMPIE